MSKVAETVSTGEEQRAEHLFKPGQSGNPRGRPKGSRNKLGEQFVSALQQDFEEHGVDAIVKVRTDMPHQYLKVIAQILPKELNINTNQLGEISDEQLSEFVDAVRLAIATGISANPRERAKAPARH